MINSAPYWPFVLYACAVGAVAVGMLLVSWLTGEKHMDRQTGIPFESGIQSTGTARVRFSIKFYLVAILFVIFDLEMVFIFAWALVIRELGWEGYFAVLTFLSVLVVALIYEWRMGFLDWYRPPNRVFTAGPAPAPASTSPAASPL